MLFSPGIGQAPCNPQRMHTCACSMCKHTGTQIYIHVAIHRSSLSSGLSHSLTHPHTTESSAVTGNSLPTPNCNNYSFYSFLQLTGVLLSMSSMQKTRASLWRPGGCREAGPLCQYGVCCGAAGWQPAVRLFWRKGSCLC